LKRYHCGIGLQNQS
ncbi:substrate binding domain of ABC-type glycine betaine transport system family protein, partial [Vibrio harveyi]